MSRKAKKYIVVLLTILMSATLVCMTASAQAEITPEVDSSSSSSSSSNSGIKNSSSQNSGGGKEGESRLVNVSLIYNNGRKSKKVPVKPGTQVGTLTTPTRKGYVFTGWTAGGGKVSSTYEIYSSITLTAQWKPSASSRQASSSSYASVDTHQQAVEQAASRAREAVSDPDALSSEDWNSILSTGSGESTGADSAASSSSSSAKGGGGSWLFPVGIALIALSACGIGAFIYLQFFNNRGGRHGPHGGGETRGGDSSDSMEFTDISSHSDGTDALRPGTVKRPGKTRSGSDDTMPIPPQVRREDETRPIPPQVRRSPGPVPPKAARRDDETRPVPPQVRRSPAPLPHDMSRSQAKPVDGARKDFDWDKFFNDDDS